MDRWFGDVLRGYSDKQYLEALFQVTTNFLISKDIIDRDEFQQFVNENFDDILKQIVERDKKYNEELLDKYKKED